ncbi:hypothetical protein N7456_011905 [Penicillium angulare]|uniref:non-specific serine/threonine protein kinase n=1 Tax=Penicillium angulare TaxID=116970 RepID=A0A9W9K060_9EURO|nr:hypothetical protein N7456_011905 [Penicillium angulare]
MDLSLFRQNNLLYSQESLSRYRPGGYHPVKLGDTFGNNRYEVHHKLGWGGFSTVWLAKDKEQEQWVSLKIMTAESSESKELQMLEYLKNHSREELSSNFVVQLLDYFNHEGPNGVHQCLVFELLGPSVVQVLQDYHEGSDKLDPDVVFHISGRNIAFTCSNLWYKTEDELFSVIGYPEVEPLARLDGTPLGDELPKQLVKAADWTEWIEEDEEDIRVFDFGESFFHGQEPENLAQPGSLRVPETIFTDKFDYRVDLCRTGYMIYAFLFQIWPFWYLGEDVFLVCQMINFVEKLPTEWEPKWRSMLTDFKLKSSHDPIIEDDEVSKVQRKFAELAPDPILEPLLPVMEGLMRFLPSHRLSAEDALGIMGNTE